MKTFKTKNWAISLFIVMSILLSPISNAIDKTKPILVIGGSLMNGSTPFNSGMQAPFGGWSTNSGNYLSVGDQLIGLGYKVINEAQAGAGTFERLACNGPTCGPAFWDSYQMQFNRALRRVNPPGSAVYNSEYVVIAMSNDCLHSDAFGVLQSTTVPCTVNDMAESIMRMVDIGQQASALGITPIYNAMIEYNDMNLPGFLAFGLDWVISEADYNTFRDLHKSTIPMVLSGSILAEDTWKDFVDLGDGLHPNEETSKKAAKRIITAIEDFEAA